MSETKAKKDESHPVDATFADGDLGKLQGILFGEQTRHFDARLTALEERLTTMISRTNSELGVRVAAIEADFGHRLSAISERIEDYRTNLRDDTSTVRDQLESETKRLDRTNRDLRKSLSTAEAGARSELAKLQKVTDKNLVASRVALEAQIAELAASVRSDKVGSAHLADLLASTAEAIRAESDESSGEKSASKSGRGSKSSGG